MQLTKKNAFESVDESGGDGDKNDFNFGWTVAASPRKRPVPNNERTL